MPRSIPRRPTGRRRVLGALTLIVLLGSGCGTATDEERTATSPSAAPAATAPPGNASAIVGCPVATEALDAVPSELVVIGFTRTEGFRHPSITQAQELLSSVAAQRSWNLTLTEDPDELTERLPFTDVLVLASTTGDVFDRDHEKAIEDWVRRGGGVVGVHAATDTEYDWPFFGELLGAWFERHPAGLQQADLVNEAPDHPATAHLPERWRFTDEFYDFDRNPRASSDVLLRLDEATAVYEPGAEPFAMGDDHPIAWTRTVDAGRAFVTNLGHRPETWCDAGFQQHLLGGLASTVRDTRR